MVKIRLARFGKKKQPTYRIVAADVRAPRDGRFLDRLGWYDPRANPGARRLELNLERIRYWLGVGARTTDTVSKLMAPYMDRESPKVAVHAPGEGGLEIVTDGSLPEKVVTPVPVQAPDKKSEEPKAAKPKAEAKVKEPKAEAKVEEPKVEEPKAEEPKAEIKAAEPKAAEPKAEIKAAEPKAAEPKAEEKAEEGSSDEEKGSA
jgi:small subunit ribosomal protein S16